ncbi:CLUMA_CG007266, isoform A [Clunio marinus]|uniref:CLUMA_CG007266, isoform A n=1 Tax=Clunio marinus TaxID=568069 RepID=A0A1J1I1V5_9DIPT|nr:CLUMA_CG007266, isoform A [Clunio marinus]
MVQRKKITKSSEAPAATGTTEANGSSAKSSQYKERPPQFRYQKVFARAVLSTAVFAIVYFTSAKEKTSTLAGVKEFLSLREHKVECSPESFETEEEGRELSSCLPAHCGRFASDNVISEAELIKLKDMTINIFEKFFPKDDEASLSFDLLSEKLSKYDSLSKNVADVLKSLQPKLIDTLSQRFKTSHDLLSITNPSYVTKVTNLTTEFSEHSHQLHYDKEANKSIHYTLIIYLTTFKKNFNGGKFIFVDMENHKKKNFVVEGKAGRTVGYTAGSENKHFLEKIVNGANYFVTLSFSCNNKALN